jgi:acyl-CoA synthetase (AMP-forming)/AMP-acid ligase II
LVECGNRLGLLPTDFGLERILTGGELVTQGLKTRAQRLFGGVRFSESYAMTETIPFGGTPCEQGHLHFQAAHGLIEVLDPLTGVPASAGQIGTLVVTPFPPFRQTTILLRYDTEDLVRVPVGRITCRLRDIPATGPILGKRKLAVPHERGWVTPRDVLEALESLESVPLPARYGLKSVQGGVSVEVVARESTPEIHRQIRAALDQRGVPLRELRVVEHRGELEHPLPLRCDLRQVQFAAPAGLAGEMVLPDLVRVAG